MVASAFLYPDCPALFIAKILSKGACGYHEVRLRW